MIFGEAKARKMAALLVRHGAWVSPAQRKLWSRAMINELEHVPRGASVLRWALGCVLVSYLERLNIMTRPLTNLPRWLLTLEMAVCLVPVTWLFIAVLTTTAQGRLPVEYGILSGSATLLGPVCLAVVMKIVFAGKSSVGRATTALLPLLAAWTVVAYGGQLLHNGSAFSQWWRDFVLIALLPSWAVVHLLQINADRRTTAAIA